MAVRRLASKARDGNVRKVETQRQEHVYGVPVPEGLHDAIEGERGNLSRAESVLRCLAISMEYDTDSADKPYYPDVVQLASELVRRSINGLDSLTLQQRLSQNKIKDGSNVLGAEEGYAILDHAPSSVCAYHCGASL